MKTPEFGVGIQAGTYSSTHESDPTDVMYGYRIEVTAPNGKKHVVMSEARWPTKESAKIACDVHVKTLMEVLRSTFSATHSMEIFDRLKGSSDPAPAHAPVVPDGVNGVKDGVIYV